MNDTFNLDFSDGRARIARGRGIEQAKADALMATEATNTSCRILRRSAPYGRVGETFYGLKGWEYRECQLPLAA